MSNSHTRRKQTREAARRPSLLASLAQIKAEADEKAERLKRQKALDDARLERERSESQLKTVRMLISALGGDPEAVKPSGTYRRVDFTDGDISFAFSNFEKVLTETRYGHDYEDDIEVEFVHGSIDVWSSASTVRESKAFKFYGRVVDGAFQLEDPVTAATNLLWLIGLVQKPLTFTNEDIQREKARRSTEELPF